MHAQIQADWCEYQVIFSGLLERFSALLSRQAKAEKRKSAELLADSAEPLRPPGPPLDRKSEVRAKAAAFRSAQVESKQPVQLNRVRALLGSDRDHDHDPPPPPPPENGEANP